MVGGGERKLISEAIEERVRRRGEIKEEEEKKNGVRGRLGLWTYMVKF